MLKILTISTFLLTCSACNLTLRPNATMRSTASIDCSVSKGPSYHQYFEEYEKCLENKENK